MRITRRELACGVAAFAAAGVAGSRTAGIREQRVYAPGSALPPRKILDRYGIQVESVQRTQDGAAYLIPFASLEARVKAWDRFNADDEWCALRDAGTVKLQSVRFYPGGKIFEMSL